MRINWSVVMTYAMLAAIVLFAAPTSAHAAIWQTRQVTNYAVEYFPSAAPDSGFWATVNGGQLMYINSEGHPTTVGNMPFDSPVSYGSNIAGYSRPLGLPVIWDQSAGTYTYPFDAWPVRPWVGPRTSQDGSKLVFGTGTGEIAVYDGVITDRWTAFDRTQWQVASIDWLPNGQLLATAQNHYDPYLGGYNLFIVDPATHTTTNLGDKYKGYSKVAVSGHRFLMTSRDHRIMSAWVWTPHGPVWTENVPGGQFDYWNLGGASNGRFSAMNFANRLCEVSVIPEPSSILALGAGFVGFISILTRRRYPPS